jgi:hypothetical protein
MKITQSKINKGIISKYEQINPKLNETNVYFEGDYSEMYVVQADVTEDEAYWAMRLYDSKECGCSAEDEGVNREWLEAVKFYEGKSPDGDEDGWWYLHSGKGRKFLSKGWIARI